MNTLLNLYKNEVLNKIKLDLNYKSIMQVPKIKKVTLNVGIGNAYFDKKLMDSTINNISIISGQKPFITKAKKSIASFKVRKGYPMGCKVTLRNNKM